MNTAPAIDASNSTVTEPPVACTDDQIIAQLATLQQLHESIFELRSLLPERLIDPARAAVDTSGPGSQPPAALAKHLSGVAVDGDKDIKAFEERWRSEDMKEVWSKAKTTDFPQGSDVWNVDYLKVAKLEAMEKRADDKIPADEDVDDLIEKFRSLNKIPVQKRDGNSDSVFDVAIAGLKLTIKRPGSEAGGQVGDWYVEARPGTQLVAGYENVLRCLQERPQKQSLGYLLNMISSYKDLKTRPCNKCSQVFDDEIQLPTIRIPDPKSASGPPQFLAYHLNCRPQS